jgi:hypothetical protein
MRSYRNVLLATALSALVVTGTLWAEDTRRLPLIKVDQKAVAAQTSDVSRAIIDVIDFYAPVARYHATISDPNVPWQVKCELAMFHRRLHLLSSDLGGKLGGTREVGTSTLQVRLTCPDQEAVEFEIPASFEVHTAPHPDEVREMSFDTEMYSIDGSATDIGPFASIRLKGGASNGYSSPGRTSLKSASEGALVVESSFTIGYYLEFEGAKGGPLEGLSGKTESSIEMQAVGK